MEKAPELRKAKLENQSSKVLFSVFSSWFYESTSMKQIPSYLNQHQVGEVASTSFTLDPTWWTYLRPDLKPIVLLFPPSVSFCIYQDYHLSCANVAETKCNNIWRPSVNVGTIPVPSLTVSFYKRPFCRSSIKLLLLGVLLPVTTAWFLIRIRELLLWYSSYGGLTASFLKFRVKFGIFLTHFRLQQGLAVI